MAPTHLNDNGPLGRTEWAPRSLTPPRGCPNSGTKHKLFIWPLNSPKSNMAVNQQDVLEKIMIHGGPIMYQSGLSPFTCQNKDTVLWGFTCDVWHQDVGSGGQAQACLIELGNFEAWSVSWACHHRSCHAIPKQFLRRGRVHCPVGWATAIREWCWWW